MGNWKFGATALLHRRDRIVLNGSGASTCTIYKRQYMRLISARILNLSSGHQPCDTSPLHSMFKRALLSSLMLWSHVGGQEEHLAVNVPLIPLLDACASSSFIGRPWSVRDAYICGAAFDAASPSREVTSGSHITLDVFPDVCGDDMDPASSRCPQIWSDTITEWWRNANYGWNMSSPVREAVFKSSDTWKDVIIRGDWVQVGKILGCLGGMPATEANTT
jgi:hypothetical protein